MADRAIQSPAAGAILPTTHDNVNVDPAHTAITASNRHL